MNRIYRKKFKSQSTPNHMIVALIMALCTPFILAKLFSHNDDLSENYNSYDNIVMLDGDIENHPKNLSQPVSVVTKLPPHKDPVKTIITKPAVLPTVLKNRQWTQVTLKKGDTLSKVFTKLNLGNGLLQDILRQTGQKRVLGRLHTGDAISFYVINNKLERFKLPYGAVQEIEIYREGRVFRSKIVYRAMTTRQVVINTEVKRNIYFTARQLGIPNKLLQQAIHVLSSSINLSRGARNGDRIGMIYNANYVDNKLITYGNLLYASYQTGDKKYQAIYFEDRPGHGDYYNESGKNSKKAFDRYPVNFSHISSSFSNSRYHPILHYSRPHRGVDLAAHIGTPIRSTGDGRIEFIGRHGGYGNMIKIRHDRTFETLYGHMLRFERGITRGSWVKRGQVIGYVGQTGLAAGPHCHFEVHMNNQAKNPATVPIPLSSPLSGRVLARFRSTQGSYVAKVNNARVKTYLAKK